MSNKNIVVKCSHVLKDYRVGKTVVPVLSDVNWEIERGKWTALLGDSGSGKTTLMNLMSSLEKPTSGSIQVDGVDVSGLSGSAAATFRARKLGFVFQSYHLLPELTVLENVMLPALMIGERTEKVRLAARELLEKMSLEPRLGHLPGELSGGEQQRCAIARALINRPLLLMADEPTGNLDARTGDDILALFGALRTEGSTIVMITHSDKVAALADAVFKLEAGRVSAR